MATPGTSPAPGKLSLLLIDDDAELCGMMQEFFAENGHRVTAVHNGREGLARALEGQYDLVILDVMLPQINGFTLLHQIRRQSAVPVIAEESRDTNSGGIGLGLSIAMRAVQVHQGTITAENANPGLKVQIVLPLLSATEKVAMQTPE
jgi:CheY-like chemotaxis protein